MALCAKRQYLSLMTKFRTFLVERYRVLFIEQYRLFFIGSTLSRIGNGIQFLTINWIIIDLWGSVSAAAFLAALTAIAGMVITPVGGLIADRSDPRKIHLVLDIVLAVTALSLPIAITLRSLTLPHIMTVILILAAGNRLSVVLSRVIVRHSVPDTLLLEANSTLSFSNQIGSLSGSIIGGFLIAIHFEAIALTINSLSFLTSAICLALMLSRGSIITYAITNQAFKSRFREWGKDFFKGVAYARGNKEALKLYGSLVIFMCGLTLLNTTLPALVKTNLGGWSVVFGVIDAGLGVGGMISSVFIPSIVRRYGQRRTILYTAIGFATLTAFLPFSFSVVATLILYVFSGALFHGWVVLLTAAQWEIDHAFQGRVQSLYELGVSIATLLVSGFLYFAIQHSLVFAYISYSLVLGISFLAFSRFSPSMFLPLAERKQS